MAQVSAYQKTSGGRPIGWVIGGGFYPSLAEKGKIKRKFAFQAHPGKREIFSQGFSRSSVEYRASEESFTNMLKKKLFAKGARYVLRGNYAWWQNGMDNLNVSAVGKELFNFFSGIEDNKGFTSALSSVKSAVMAEKGIDILDKAAEKRAFNKAKAETLFNDIFEGYEKFETQASSKVKAMVEIMIDQQLTGKDLQQFGDTYWEEHGKTLADVSEEEWKILNKSQLLSGKAGFEAPGEAVGAANKVDMKAWIMRNGKKIELAYDVTEELVSGTDTAKQGGHGLGRRINWGGGRAGAPNIDFDWITKNKETVETAVRKHFTDEIDDIYNPIIKDIKAHLIKQRGEPISKDKPLKPEEIAKSVKSGDIVSGAILANTKTAELLNKWVNPNEGYPVKKGKGKQKKTKLTGFILHNIMNINETTGKEFSQMHRVSERGEIGDAWYAQVPMSMHPIDTKKAYEFLTEGVRSPEATELMRGPNATLALLVKEKIIEDFEARELAAQQAQVFAVGQMHAGTSKTNADGTSLSQCNAFIADGSKTKHATTVTFAPGVIVKFFEDFVKQLTTRDNEVIEKLAKQALNQNTQQINSGGSASNFNKFWALPFIAI